MEELFYIYGDTKFEIRQLIETKYVECSIIGCSTALTTCCSTGIKC